MTQEDYLNRFNKNFAAEQREELAGLAEDADLPLDQLLAQLPGYTPAGACIVGKSYRYMPPFVGAHNTQSITQRRHWAWWRTQEHAHAGHVLQWSIRPLLHPMGLPPSSRRLHRHVHLKTSRSVHCSRPRLMPVQPSPRAIPLAQPTCRSRYACGCVAVAFIAGHYVCMLFDGNC